MVKRGARVSETNVSNNNIVEVDNIDNFSTNLNLLRPKMVPMAKYAYTLNLVPWRRVRYGKQFKSLKSFEYDDQCIIVKDIIRQYTPDVYNKHIFGVEATKQGIAHVHGSIICTEDDIYLMQKHIHDKHGYKNDDPERLFKVVKIYDSDTWEEYCLKNQ